MSENPRWADSYADGVPLHLNYGDATLSEQFEAAARQFADRDALDFMGRTTTYADLAREVGRVAKGLLHYGVQPGDRVAILLPNCPQNIIATEAIMRIGAIAVQHNPLYTATELTPQFVDHQAKVAIVWDKEAATIVEVAQHCDIETIVTVNLIDEFPLMKRVALRLPIPSVRAMRNKLTGRTPDGLAKWDDLLRHGELPLWRPRPTKDDVAIMLYTSGTSGKPKGVPLTHAQLAANAEQGRAWAALRPGREIFLCVLPMFHAYGLSTSVLAGINLGACLLVLPAPEIPLILDAFKRRLPTFAPAVPPLYARILDEANERKVDLHGLRVGLSGAMSLPKELVQRWENATGGYLIEGYGLTETSPVVVGNPISDERRAGSIGVPYPDVEIRLADPEDVSKDAPEGGPGELLVKGPQVFSGYFNNPEETEKAFYDGYFRTGDVVEMDERGFLTVVDRIKELIVTGGFNVYPSEVEGVLRQHDAIDDAAVVGHPNETGSEDVIGVLVLKDGASEPARDELRTHVKEYLTAYKAPRRFVVIDELPKNPMGKVLRREVAKIIHQDEKADSSTKPQA